MDDQFERVVPLSELFPAFLQRTRFKISPIVHLTENGFFFFPKQANDFKSENATLGKAVCLFYIFTYYETFNVLALHFVYRYMIIVDGKMQEWTASWRTGHWVAAAISFMMAHTTLLLGGFILTNSLTNEHSVFGEDNGEKVENHALFSSLDSSTFINLYGVNTSDEKVGYVIIEFRRLNKETGRQEYDLPTMMTLLMCMSMFGVSASVMVLCSGQIIEALRGMKVSNAKKTQNRMLFRALLIQTLVPCIFSYLPFCIIWLWPLITGVALGAFGNILTMITTIFPSVDAILIIYFIPAYKNSLKMWILSRIRPSDVVIVSSYSLSDPTIRPGIRKIRINNR